MINLTPISKRIQNRLFEKMKVLGRESGESIMAPRQVFERGLSPLDLNKLSTRSTFMRMTSGLAEPVMLVGGEPIEGVTESLNIFKNMAAGYDEIYGPRQYISYDPEDNFEMVGENKFKRPMPGLKSADISFKGGIRALREATVSWTCWSFDDINRLMPHFLSHGHEVLLEWAWVYDETSLRNLPTLVDRNGFKRSAYRGYSEIVDENLGDFDFMIGIIKNFEFTSRDDGGFDCQTIITSVGASVVDATTPNRNIIDKVTTYNIRKSESIHEQLLKLKRGLGSPEELVEFDVGVTLKTFIGEIDTYLMSHYIGGQTAKVVTKDQEIDFGALVREGNDTSKKKEESGVPSVDYMIKDNAYIVSEFADSWVQWGWFEDNILSKFLSLVSDSRKNPLVTEFRSIERVTETKIGLGEAFNKTFYESVKIRNHSKLETVNINSYILPGQFKIFQPEPEEVEDEVVKTEEIDNNAVIGSSTSGTLKPPKNAGDPDPIKDLHEMIKSKFDAFSTENANVEEYKGTFTQNTKLFKDYPDMKGKPFAERKEFWENTAVTKQTPTAGKYGYLRNMLINTKVLKEAFGTTVESISVREALENMFSILNREIYIWDFNIVQDQVVTNRSKIIDEQVTALDFKLKTKISDGTKRTKSTKSVYFNGDVVNQGVFFFPVWNNESITKRQNITAKVPNAMALSIMYGANYDDVRTLGKVPSEATSIETAALAGMFKFYTDENPNVNMKNIEIALKKDGFERIGASGNIGPLSKSGGSVNLKQWMMDNKSLLESHYDEKVQSINAQITKQSKGDLQHEDFSGYLGTKGDQSIPFPLPSELYKSDPAAFHLLVSEDDKGVQRNIATEYRDLYSSKYHANGRMKQAIINTVANYISATGKFANNKKPLLIPLELELEIDGIGGIIPGNSFHSTYLPKRYQEESVFQVFDINHRVDNSGWTVTLNGKMRSTVEKLTKSPKKFTMEEAWDAITVKQAQLNEKKVKEVNDQVKEQEAPATGMDAVGKARTIEGSVEQKSILDIIGSWFD